MTVLTALQSACTVIGLEVPSVVYGSTEREHTELASLTNEMAKRIAQSYDWQRLKTVATITGDGATEDWSLPTDYAGMIKKANLWSTSQPTISLVHQPDSDRWLYDEVTDFTTITPQWTIYGGQIHIRPALALADAVRYFYLSNIIVSGSKTAFTADADTFLLDERLLSLGVIWQWKANKGLPYAEDMANYEDALANLIGGDKGSNILVVGNPRLRMGATYAFPAVITP